MEELNKAFDEYMVEFKKLGVNAKRQEVLNSLKEFIAIVDYLAEGDNVKLNYLQSSEIKDIPENCECLEEEYLEGLMVYVEVAKNLVGEYLEKRN